jgi:16S rRNA (guanine966-N2)-methyltransferase
MAKPIYTDKITAGSLKGRTLILPQDDSIRPTKNRVRQAVFNLLGARLDWEGQTVADVCCGSGAWGLEALSRGAANVLLVDTQTAPAAQNIAAFRLTQGLKLVKANAKEWTPEALLDVVLADPPYNTDIANNLLKRAKKIGKPGSWWAIESALEDKLDWTGFEDLSTRLYGVCKITVGRLV